MHSEKNDTHEKTEFSILMPCLNEASHIKRCVDSLVPDLEPLSYEILVIDGGSTDGTKDIVGEMQRENARIKLLDNPFKLQAHALNIGIQHSRGEILVRIDAHSIYPPKYVLRCRDLSLLTGAENVGGVMQPVGHGPVQQAIAAGIQHPMGAGNSPHRRGHRGGYCDTVYLGTYRRSIFEKVGHFDPLAHPNEDAEMDWRIRKAGGSIYVDNTLRVSYVPRESIFGLAVQFFRYGKGRAYTTMKHRVFTSYRQLAPPALILVMVGSGLGSFLMPLLGILPLLYGACLSGAALMSGSAKGWRVKLWLPVVFATMHLAWGAGFLYRFGMFLCGRGPRPASTVLQSA